MADLTPPAAPESGEALAPAHPSAETLALLALRRSTAAKHMSEPGPSPEQRDALIQLGARVPDHGKLFPWRFVVFEGEARARFGDILEARLRELEPDGPDKRYDLERNRFLRAPTVVAVISRVRPEHKIPEWEQVLSAGAACQNLLIGASAMGFAAQWLTEWYAYDDVTTQALGLGENERVAGFIYLGTATQDAEERKREAPDITRWG